MRSSGTHPIKTFSLGDAPGSGATITVSERTQVPNDPPFICLTVESSHDSAAGGVALEGSFDNGVSWSTLFTDSYAAADGVTTFQAPAIAPRMRWRYANSANVLTKWKGFAYMADNQVAA